MSARRYVYFWADGIHVQARLEDDAQCLLVIIGATPEGRKELVGLVDGVRESAQSWRDLLLDLRRRGLAMGPELAVADGALGFWKAIEEVWPTTRGQRCWVHKTANVLNKLPKSLQAKAKRALHEIWMAETKADAEAALGALRSAMRALTRLGIVVESISKFARELERYHPGLHEQISKEVIRRYVDREGNGAFANTAPSVSKRRLRSGCHPIPNHQARLVGPVAPPPPTSAELYGISGSSQHLDLSDQTIEKRFTPHYGRAMSGRRQCRCWGV